MKNVMMNKRVIGVVAAVAIVAALVVTSGSWGSAAAKTSVMNSEIPSLSMSPGPDIPHLLNYQGLLNDKDGNRVPDGTYHMTFSIYDSAADGIQLWPEAQDVDVSGGLFNVLLGGVNPIPLDVFQGGANRWLGVKVGSDAEMTPRQRIVSVAYAYVADDADTLDGNDSADFVAVAGDTMTGTLNLPVDGLVAGTDQLVLFGGHVGIGTAYPSPVYQLEVRGGTNTAVLGESSSSTGVYGHSASGCGVIGESSDAYGVYGKSSDSYGMYGGSLNNIGVGGCGATWDFYAGCTGTYGSFTGAHEVKLSRDFPESIKFGMVVSVTGETQVRKTDEDEISFSSTLPTVQLSHTPNDSKVLGALISESPLPEEHWYINESDAGDRFGIVGEGRVWVTNVNGDIEAGDYITTSAIAGYGQKQDDDLLHSYTLGKAIEDVDWSEVVETVEFNGQTYKAYPISVVYTSG